MAAFAVAQSVLMLLVGKIDRSFTAAVKGNLCRAFFCDSSSDYTRGKDCKNETYYNDDRLHRVSPMVFLNLSKGLGVYADG